MIKIRIYNDYVHNNGVLLKRLTDICPKANIEMCDAEDILKGCLTGDVALFVMPGGADLYFCERLNGAANRTIRAFVEDGGSYLGICAGAYYGASSLDWAKDEAESRIHGVRELGFVQACAEGPIYDYIETGDFTKSHDGIARLLVGEDEISVLYRGGCRFSDVKDAEVIARYDDLDGKPPAIVKAICGKGRVVLSGPHIEYRSDDYLSVIYRHLNPSYQYQRKCAENLAAYDAQIDALWQKIVLDLCDKSA